MNFSIPDDVKEAFNEAFKGDNKSAIVTEMMRREIERKRLRDALKQRDGSFLDGIQRRMATNTRSYSEDEIRALREIGRP
ncbi:MAG: hypothetical protein ABL908_01560 [Hyphomicrobium sp.]